MAIRTSGRLALLGGAWLAVAGCGESESGPIAVSAIGAPPQLVNPNLKPLDAASSFLLEAAAQGLVRFDRSGQVEPALAQSWIVSDDGLRYTFRLARTRWSTGGPVTAEQVVERLKAASSRASRNPLKPLLGAIAEIEAMTDDVLEISLKSPRPNFLQLLAQPEMALLRRGAGTGPFRIEPRSDGSLFLTEHDPEQEEEEEDPHGPPIVLRGEPAARAVARFDAGRADLVAGGTIGDLAIARAAEPPAAALRFDPVAGMLGLAFTGSDALWADPAARNALSMAVDRAALVAALGVPGLQARESLVPPGVEELPNPALPEWAASPQPMRREAAARTIRALAGGQRPTLEVAVPEGPGYRLLFAHLRRDWRAIGVDAASVAADEPADLRLVDAVAPVGLASWYLRHFTCDVSRVCSGPADGLLALARTAANAHQRQLHLAAADQLIRDAAPFIALAAPVRWSLVSPRLRGFQPNPFGRRFPGTLAPPAE
ncbi:MAG TPA: ABC transporter substrate-binding protein [Allosphingosinicella sp.]|nr:ABC transporter substrate-binding protein [Allosphingosinicella sp.]